MNKIFSYVWGLGIGDWGLGMGLIPNSKSPIPNQLLIKISY